MDTNYKIQKKNLKKFKPKIEQFLSLNYPIDINILYEYCQTEGNIMVNNIKIQIKQIFDKFAKKFKAAEIYKTFDPIYNQLFSVDLCSLTEDEHIMYFEHKFLKCPNCGYRFECSPFLAKIFKTQPKVEFLANLVTHFRHNHLTSWNKCWGRYGGAYRRGWFGNYDEEKTLVNERQKRQILRKCKQFLIEHEFTSEDFTKLQNTTQETIDLAIKILGK